MENLAIPDDVRAFIGKYIGSVQQLDVLLFVSREQRREWTAEEIGKRLHINPASVSNRLLNLWTKKLLDLKEGAKRAFRYHSLSRGLDETIQKLAELCEKNKAMVIEIIYSKAENELRSFSDAFKLKKDDDA